MTSSSNTGPPANCGTHHTHIHTLTGYDSSYRVTMLWWGTQKVHACVWYVCACFYLAHITLRIHTNVFISGPVKMSSLCLFSPHSEWHNIGLKDAIINLNVPWHFPPPPSTCVKTLITALTEDWSLSQLHGLQEKVKSNQLTSFTWRSLFSDTCAET